MTRLNEPTAMLLDLPAGWVPQHGEWQPMQVDRGQLTSTDAGARSGHVAPARWPDVAWVAETARAMACRTWGLALRGTVMSDAPCVMRYGPGDGYTWHADGGPESGGLVRKAGWSLQLSEGDSYGGGGLEFAGIALRGEDHPMWLRDRGRLVVFTAATVHRVSTVTRGERLALVGWLYGPGWR